VLNEKKKKRKEGAFETNEGDWRCLECCNVAFQNGISGNGVMVLAGNGKKIMNVKAAS